MTVLSCPLTVIDGNEIIYRDYIDISVAVATPKVLESDDNGPNDHSVFVCISRVLLFQC